MVTTEAADTYTSPSVRDGFPSWIDENTGRRVWQITTAEQGAMLGYFRYFRHLPDGRMLLDHTGLATSRPGRTDPVGGLWHGNLGLMDPDSGAIEVLPLKSKYLKLRPSDGRVWHLQRKSGELWTTLLPDMATQELVATVPLEIAHHVTDITIDGKTLIVEEREQESVVPPEGASELEALWMRFRRKRSGTMSAYDIASGTLTPLVLTQDVCTFHVDTSPVDPGLVRYARDVLECMGQRMFTIRTDGSQDRVIRVQEPG